MTAEEKSSHRAVHDGCGRAPKDPFPTSGRSSVGWKNAIATIARGASRGRDLATYGAVISAGTRTAGHISDGAPILPLARDSRRSHIVETCDEAPNGASRVRTLRRVRKTRGNPIAQWRPALTRIPICQTLKSPP